MNQPPIPSPWPEPEEISAVLTCPYCQHKFKLTWKRYWRSPFGKHTCPECFQLSKIQLPVKFWVVNYMIGFLGAVPPAIWLYYMLGDFAGFVSWFVSYLVIALPLNRYLEEKYAILKKIKAK